MAAITPRLARSVRTARLGRRLFALSLVVYLTTAGGSLTTTDAVAAFDVTRSIAEHGSVAMSGNLLGREIERGRDGRYYSPFGLGQSLYNLPFYLAAKAFVRTTGVRIGKPDSLAKAFVALGETVLAAAIVRESFLLACAATENVVAAVSSALVLAFATILWPYSGFGFNQPLACLTLVAAIRHAVIGVRRDAPSHLIFSGWWIAAGLMTRHEMALAVIPVAAWAWWDGTRPVGERVRRILALAPGVTAGVLAWLAYNAVRFGNPLETGYLNDPTPGFGSPILAGLVALLASPSASLFLYSPAAFLGVAGLVALARRDRSIAILLASVVVLFLGCYSTLGNWIGGRSYGSRYLVVILPYMAVGCAAMFDALSHRTRRAVFAAVMVIGIVIQIPGVLIDYAKVGQSVDMTVHEREWRAADAPLVLNTRALIRAVPDNIAYVTGHRRPPTVATTTDEADRTFSQQFSFSLDVWWLYLYYLHVLSRVALLGIVAILSATSAGLLLGVAREMRHTETASVPA